MAPASSVHATGAFPAMPRLPHRPPSLAGFVPAHRAPPSDRFFDPDMARLLLSGRVTSAEDAQAAKSFLSVSRACQAFRIALCARAVRRLRRSQAINLIFSFVCFSCNTLAHYLCVSACNVSRIGPVILLGETLYAYKPGKMLAEALKVPYPENIFHFDLTDGFQSLILIYASCVRAAFKVVTEDLARLGDAARRRSGKKGNRGGGRRSARSALHAREVSKLAAAASEEMKGVAKGLYSACRIVESEEFAREVLEWSGCKRIEDAAASVVSNLRHADDVDALSIFLLRFCGMTRMALRSAVKGHFTML